MLIQGFQLTTQVRLPQGESIPVFVYYDATGVQLCTEDKTCIGSMSFKIIATETEWLNTFIPPHLYIVDMGALVSSHHYIGTALHEFAFRLSIENGLQGRVRLDAVRNSHFFHVNNGFRLERASLINSTAYYIKIAKALFNARANNDIIRVDLGSSPLYLPSDQIQNKRKQWGIVADDSQLPIQEAEKHYAQEILQEAKQATQAIKVLIGLNVAFGPPRKQIARNDQRMWMLRTAENKKNTTINCEVIREILDLGCVEIARQLPIDTEEKKDHLAITLAGTMILAMLFYDREYPKHELFNKQFLYPQVTLDDLLNKIDPEGSMNNTALINRIGREALIDKTLFFDGTIRMDVFPVLSDIPELKTIFDAYLPPDETVNLNALF